MWFVCNHFAVFLYELPSLSNSGRDLIPFSPHIIMQYFDQSPLINAWDPLDKIASPLVALLLLFLCMDKGLMCLCNAGKIVFWVFPLPSGSSVFVLFSLSLTLLILGLRYVMGKPRGWTPHIMEKPPSVTLANAHLCRLDLLSPSVSFPPIPGRPDEAYVPLPQFFLTFKISTSIPMYFTS